MGRLHGLALSPASLSETQYVSLQVLACPNLSGTYMVLLPVSHWSPTDYDEPVPVSRWV